MATDSNGSPKSGSEAKSVTSDRADRLAAQLRDNLKKRKALKRARAAVQKADQSGDGAASGSVSEQEK